MKLEDYLYKVDYTWVKTKTAETEGKKYDLLSPAGRRLYFNAKIGKELEALREFLKSNTFIAYLLAPKQAGKGTYTNMLMEAVGKEYFDFVSVGDIVRDEKEQCDKYGKECEMYKYMQENYRGMVSLDDALEGFVSSSQEKLAPTEFILTLVKRKIDEIGHKTIFIDGFPRKADQLAYSLYFRELVNYRDDPDFFVLINLPLQVIEERLKGRVTCPKCRDSRHTYLLPTSIVKYDEGKGEYYLMCDNPNCERLQLEPKEGDDKGIELIRGRIEDDLDLMAMARKMYGVPRIELYNSIEQSKAGLYVDDYEITDKYIFSGKGEDITREAQPWTVSVGSTPYYSLLAPAVIIQYVKQLCHLFRLG